MSFFIKRTALSIVAMSAVAYAQSADEGKNAEHASSTLPDISIKGDSSGSAKFSLGLSWTANDGTDADVTKSIIFTTKTKDGVSNLLSVDSNGTKATDWGLAGGWSKVLLPPFKQPTAAFQKARAAAWNACAQACRPGSTDLICQIERHPALVREAEDADARYEQALLRLEVAFLTRDVHDQCASKNPPSPLRERCEELTNPGVETPSPTPARADDLSKLLGKLAPGPETSASNYVDAHCKVLTIPRDEGEKKLADSCAKFPILASDRDRLTKELSDADESISKESIAGREPNAITLDYPLFCAAGQALIDKPAKAYRDQRAARPDGIVSIAGTLTETKHDYLEPGTAMGTYKPGSAFDFGGGAAVALMYRFDHASGFGRLVDTVEVPLQGSFGKDPASTTAKWCTPAGQVVNKDGSMTAAESCNERALGLPKSVTRAQGSLLLGFEGGDSPYRLTFGLTGSLTGQEHGKPGYTWGLTMPFYVNTNLLPDDKGVFKGILRVTPSFLSTRDLDGTTDTKFVVTLELLTGRSMYPVATNLL